MADYSLGELQDAIGTLEDFFETTKSKDEKKLIGNLYEKIAQHYNQRAGKRIYNKTIYG